MTRIKIRHYVVKRRGMGFWQPTRKMRGLGFYSVPCGRDGPSAWAIAEQWNLRWDKTRRGEQGPGRDDHQPWRGVPRRAWRGTAESGGDGIRRHDPAAHRVGHGVDLQAGRVVKHHDGVNAVSGHGDRQGGALARRGEPLDRSLSGLNLARPDLVRDLHAAYLAAGADIVQTNTFDANRPRLARAGLQDSVAGLRWAS